MDLFDIRRLFDDDWFDSLLDVEKKFIVCVGTGNVKFVVGNVDCSSCFAVDDDDDVSDDELDVEDDDVVRFFLPVTADDGDGREVEFT